MSKRAIFSAKILGAIFLLVVLALLQVTPYFDLPRAQQGLFGSPAGTAAPEAAPQFVGEIDTEGLKIEARLTPGERRLELSFTNTSTELNFWVKTTALYWTVIVDDLKNQYAVDSVSLSPENSVNLKIEPGQSQVIGTVLNKPVSSEATEIKIFLQDVTGVYHGKKAGGSPKDFTIIAQKTTPGPIVQPGLPALGIQAGNFIAFVSERDGNPEIYLMPAVGGNPTNLTNHPADDHSPTWSPDGKRIAFVSNRSGSPQVYAMNPDGADLVQLTAIPDTAGWWNLSWDPDGARLVAARIPVETQRPYPDKGQMNIYLVNADGSGSAQLTENKFGNDLQPLWSPDGTRIAFVRLGFNSTEIYSIEPYGSGLKNLSSSGRNDGPFVWSPDGTTLIYASSSTHCFPDDCPLSELRSVQADGINRTVLLTFDKSGFCFPEEILLSSKTSYALFVSFDGEGLGRLCVFDGDENKLIPMLNLSSVSAMPGWLVAVDWSPDGELIVFDSDRGGNRDIYILKLLAAFSDPSLVPVHLTTDPARDYSPAWQPIP